MEALATSQRNHGNSMSGQPAGSKRLQPGSTIAKGASSVDRMSDKPHDTNGPRFRCCLFCAYRNVSDFHWGNILYTGKNFGQLFSVEDAPAAPLRMGR